MGPTNLAAIGIAVLTIAAGAAAAAPGNAPADDGNAGPPDDLPGPVPDFVGDVHDLIREFLSGDLGEDLGTAIKDVVPGGSGS